MIKGNKKLIGVLIKAAAIAAAVAVMLVFDSFTSDVLEKLVFESVGTYLPKQGLTVKSEKVEEKIKKEASSASEKNDVKNETELTSELIDVLKEKEIAYDEDVTLLMKSALEKSGYDKKGGEIYEYTFTTDGVTDSYGNVLVKNVNETQIDIASLLERKADLKVEKGKPSVLIYHTHTTETYQLVDRDFYASDFNARTDDSTQNMVRVGAAIKQELENAGFTVVHDTNIYDKPYSGAYYRSEDSVKAYLEKYPTIDITLDIHRDAIENDEGMKTKPTAVIDGKKAAQIMIISGCQEDGNGITDLPDWEENLVFALQLQDKAQSLFSSLMRPLYFCPRSYNMSLTHCSLLIEMGSDSNTLGEAVYSGRLLGRALGELLKEYD